MATNIKINCGGSAISPFAADAYYSGGNSNDYTNNSTNTSGVSSPPPASVYSTARYCGTSFTYSVTGLSAATTYKVRLHFSEVGGAAVGYRVGNYNVSSGSNLTANALTNFDINAAAGGVNIAIVREFNVTPNSSGTITISCAPVSVSNPLLNAFEILEQIPPTITTTSPLPAGTNGTTYSLALATTGGASPVTFSVTAGALPAGLSLSSGGVLSGTPSAVGSFSFTVTATDAIGLAGSQAFSLTINAVNPWSPLTGLTRERYNKMPPDWKDVITETTFQDGGKSFNLLSSVAPQRWELSYPGLSPSEAAIFDAHFAACGYHTAFDYVDKDGTLYNYVYYLPGSFTKSHPRNQQWNQTRSVVLIKYPYTTNAVFF